MGRSPASPYGKVFADSLLKAMCLPNAAYCRNERSGCPASPQLHRAPLSGRRCPQVTFLLHRMGLSLYKAVCAGFCCSAFFSAVLRHFQVCHKALPVAQPAWGDAAVPPALSMQKTFNIVQ